MSRGSTLGLVVGGAGVEVLWRCERSLSEMADCHFSRLAKNWGWRQKQERVNIGDSRNSYVTQRKVNVKIASKIQDAKSALHVVCLGKSM